MIETDFTFENIDWDGLYQILGKPFQKLTGQEKHQASIKAAERDFKELVRPLLVWERVRIEEYSDNQVTVADGTAIGGGRLLEIIAGAEEVVTGVCTVGDELEIRAKEEMIKGNSVYGMVLDILANWGVDQILQQFYYTFRDEIKEKENLRTSILMNPGHAGWDITGQGEIFRVVGHHIPENKMRISESHMLYPIKSQSFFFGIGKNKLGREKGVICSMCEIFDTCQYGRLKIAAWKKQSED